MKVVLGAENRLDQPRTIHRMSLQVQDTYSLEMPCSVTLLKAGPGRGTGYYIELWYERPMQSCARTQKIEFYIYGTGAPIERGQYVDTVVMPDGLVWHVYAEVQK